MTAEQAKKTWESADVALAEDPTIEHPATDVLVRVAQEACATMTNEEVIRFHTLYQ